MADDDEMNVPGVIDKLGTALTLQHRSVVQLTLAAGGTTGLAHQALAEQFALWADAELRDARLLVEKLCGLGGVPPTEVAPVRWAAEAEAMSDIVIESETEVVAALHAVIPDTGQEPRSEALEHLMEHIILRKQHQIDALVRARGITEG
ncbi:MAG TPA: ferritin-like domain-containing protein [Acidimicrobiales bacterium]|nr:ferritin-like domain-containing protein [Acidimicrobiales bacterium]